MNSEYQKSVSEKPLAADCCSGHSRQEARPTLGAPDEHFLDHTRATFTIQGMTCGGCAKRIKDALTNLPGVSNASVAFETRQATIDFDPERVDYQSIRNVVSAAGYTIEGDGDGEATVKKKTPTAKVYHLKPYTYGLLAGSTIIAFYLGLITLTSDWINARYQFAEYQWWVIALAAGLGIQVTLYVSMRRQLNSQALKGAGAGMAASGGMSATAMAICCSHYLATLLPVIGLPFLSAAAAGLEQYQVQFFMAGVVSNFIGIAIMLRKYRHNNVPAVAVGN